MYDSRSVAGVFLFQLHCEVRYSLSLLTQKSVTNGKHAWENPF